MTAFDAGTTLADRFRAHSRALEASHAPSPLYVELMRRMADDLDAGGVVSRICRGWEGAPSGSVVQLRLLGGLHRMVLRGEVPELAAYYRTAGGTRDASSVWPVALAVLTAHADELADSLAIAPQTNEPGRSAALLTGVLHAVRGPVQQPFPSWSVVERRGCDLEPVDVWSADGRLRLRSFVWPDHVDRFQRLDAALEVAQRAGRGAVEVDRAPAGEWLEHTLPARSDPSALTVVWQSITRMYWPADEVERVRTVVRRWGREVPLAHVSMEYEDVDAGAVLSVDVWPGDGSPPRRRRLAHVADHGIPVRLTSGTYLGG